MGRMPRPVILLKTPLLFFPVVILPSSATRSLSTTQRQTPLLTPIASSSYRASVSPSPTSAFKSPSSTVQRPTVSSTSEPPTPVGPTECRPNTCENGGTCVVPGYFCRCPKYYVWNGCAVYVGECVLFI